MISRRHRLETNDSDAFGDQDDRALAAPDRLKIGIYGWRKRCLYLFLVLLLVIIAVNLALTIWILVVLDFNLKGIDKLEFTDDGIRLEGTAEFREPVHVRDISAIADSNLTVRSLQQVHLSVGNSTISVRNDDILVQSNRFQVSSPERDSPLLILNNGQLTVGADILEAVGTLGVRMEGPIEADTIRAHTKQQLNIESASGSMNILGSQGVSMKATAGPINIQSADELLLKSVAGSVVIDAADIQIRLPMDDNVQSTVYDVCVCQNNGRLILVASATDGTTNCANQQDLCT